MKKTKNEKSATTRRKSGTREKVSAAVTKRLVSAQRRVSIFAELWDFLRVRKKWWLGPPLLILLLLGILLIFAESSAVAPFIYTLF